jgi:BRCT domain type II-containing protein
MVTKDWIIDNFEELVKKYGGRYIAVISNRVVAVGDHPKPVEDSALRKYPDKIPSVMKIPTEDEIVCLL